MLPHSLPSNKTSPGLILLWQTGKTGVICSVCFFSHYKQNLIQILQHTSTSYLKHRYIFGLTYHITGQWFSNSGQRGMGFIPRTPYTVVD